MRKKITGKQSNLISREICSQCKVIPVLSITEIDDAVPLARALVEGGLSVLEVTLRTPNALEAIRQISYLKGVIVGVGTLLSRQDVENATKVGAKFGVSPGITEELVIACEDNGLPLLGGVSSVSDIMKMLDKGYDLLKFFPAETSGGVAALQAINGPLPQVSFCPTGGISVINAREYLTLKNVICVGGSWMATPQMIQNKDWSKITDQAHFAASLGK